MTLKRTRLKSALPDRGDAADQSPALTNRQTRPRHLVGRMAPRHLQQTKRARTARRTPWGTGQRTRTSKRRLRRRATPLDVLQIPFQVGARKVFDLRRFIIVLALTSAVLLMPQPEGLSPEGQRALALFVFTGSILALEPAPLPIAALIVPVGQIALGIDDVTGAFAPFGKPVVFLILGSLFLAEALRKHGLTRRLALYAIVFSGGQFRLLFVWVNVSDRAVKHVGIEHGNGSRTHSGGHYHRPARATTRTCAKRAKRTHPGHCLQF